MTKSQQKERKLWAGVLRSTFFLLLWLDWMFGVFSIFRADDSSWTKQTLIPWWWVSSEKYFTTLCFQNGAIHRRRKVLLNANYIRQMGNGACTHDHAHTSPPPSEMSKTRMDTDILRVRVFINVFLCNFMLLSSCLWIEPKKRRRKKLQYLYCSNC